MKDLLEPLKSTDTIADVGEGEIVNVDEKRRGWARKIEVENDGHLSATYQQFPEFPTLYHQGAGGEHQVALTFDDGPDPKWTPRILDILKAAEREGGVFSRRGERGEVS